MQLVRVRVRMFKLVTIAGCPDAGISGVAVQRARCRPRYQSLGLVVSVGRTVQEASGGKKAGGKVSTVSEQGARTLLPYYMDCIHSPTFKSGSLHGGCDVLHKPGGGNWKQAWDVFRQMDTLQIDASRCEAFVDAIAPDMKPQAGLQPFEVQLRPQSTDHDVFLQVQTHSLIPPLWP